MPDQVRNDSQNLADFYLLRRNTNHKIQHGKIFLTFKAKFFSFAVLSTAKET